MKAALRRHTFHPIYVQSSRASSKDGRTRKKVSSFDARAALGLHVGWHVCVYPRGMVVFYRKRAWLSTLFKRLACSLGTTAPSLHWLRVSMATLGEASAAWEWDKPVSYTHLTLPTNREV